MRALFFLAGICLLCQTANAQLVKQLTLDECYKLARENYPLIKQQELILKSRDYSVENAGTGYLPQLSINGQASYQSDVTQIPIKLPNTSIPVISKDQYKIYGDLNQTLYDGGVIKIQQEMARANAEVETRKLDVELYKLKDRINQLFFGVLLLDEQLKQNELLKGDIQLGVNKMEAAVANGTGLKSSRDVLKAELLKAGQRATELKSSRRAFLSMLSLFIHSTLDEATVLVKPDPIAVTSEIDRPEVGLYNEQIKALNLHNKLIKAKILPKFSLFLQGGYGRPVLNMLDNDFEPYAIGGVRMNWSLSAFYTNRKEKSLTGIAQRNIELQKETFLFNTGFALEQQNADIGKYQELQQSDKEILLLRESIKTASYAQLENGVITSNDYLREVNAEDQARQNLILHDIQMLLAIYNHQTTTGN